MIYTLNDLGLPEAVGQFARQPAGIIFFAGGPGSGRTTSAAVLAENVASTTGRKVATLNKIGPEVLRDEREAGATAFLIDGPLSVDGLAAMVEAATGGALVIATMPGDRHPYSTLVDIVQAAEDWSGRLRRDFDAALYAIIHQSLAGSALQTEVHFHDDWR
ncbi:MAG TPA: hypothetical protein VF885_25265 [Arthrobacter sp.]